MAAPTTEVNLLLADSTRIIGLLARLMAPAPAAPAASPVAPAPAAAPSADRAQSAQVQVADFFQGLNWEGRTSPPVLPARDVTLPVAESTPALSVLATTVAAYFQACNWSGGAVSTSAQSSPLPVASTASHTVNHYFQTLNWRGVPGTDAEVIPAPPTVVAPAAALQTDTFFSDMAWE